MAFVISLKSASTIESRFLLLPDLFHEAKSKETMLYTKLHRQSQTCLVAKYAHATLVLFDENLFVWGARYTYILPKKNNM